MPLKEIRPWLNHFLAMHNRYQTGTLLRVSRAKYLKERLKLTEEILHLQNRTAEPRPTRRKTLRAKLCVPVSLYPVNGGKSAHAFTTSLSVGGFGVIGNLSSRKGSLIDFDLSVGTDIFSGRAAIAGCRRRAKDEFALSLAFREPRLWERLDDVIFDSCLRQLLTHG